MRGNPEGDGAGPSTVEFLDEGEVVEGVGGVTGLTFAGAMVGMGMLLTVGFTVGVKDDFAGDGAGARAGTAAGADGDGEVTLCDNWFWRGI